MNQIFTLADFCAEYLQGHQDYKIEGKELFKYESILKNLIEFKDSELIIVTAPTFLRKLDNKTKVSTSTSSYKFNALNLNELKSHKYIYLYSIYAFQGEWDENKSYSINFSYDVSNPNQSIGLRYFVTNDITEVNYDFQLKSKELLETINNQLTGLTEKQLKDLIKHIDQIKQPSYNPSIIKKLNFDELHKNGYVTYALSTPKINNESL